MATAILMGVVCGVVSLSLLVCLYLLITSGRRK